MKRCSLAFFASICLGLFLGLAVTDAAQADPWTGMRQPEQNKSDEELRRMIGQMLLVGFLGDGVDAAGYKTVLTQAEKGEITGVLYLKRNIRSKASVQTLNQKLQSVAATKLLIAVDQEGGKVQRLTPAIDFKDTPAAAQLAKAMTPAAARSVYAELATDLASLGFNVNFGPVVDLNVNPSNPIIGKLGRSYSADPQEVIGYAVSFVEAHREHGVLTALKHFPGHGSSKKDSHKGMANVTKTWHKEELQPFEELILRHDADMVMSSHVINSQLSGDDTPTSLSRKTLTGVLREQLHFTGVIVSDDMQMEAIYKTRSLKEAVSQAVLAGNDILIFSNDKHPDPLIPEKVATILSEAAEKDPAMRARIIDAARHIARLKAMLLAKKSTPLPIHADKDSRDDPVRPRAPMEN